MSSRNASERPETTSGPDIPSLLLSALLLVVGVTVLVDASGVEAPPGAGVVGPAAFMWAIGGGLLALGVMLGLVSLRGRADEELASNPLVAPPPEGTAHDGPTAEGPAQQTAPEPPRPFLRIRPAGRVAVLLAGLLVHAAIISTAGYIVAAAVLFVSASLAFGAPRLLPPLLIGTVLAVGIFYAFTQGLGLALPYLGGG